MTTKEKMFLESKAWVLEKLNLDPNYFKRLAEAHNPNILWIGCIDNLVAARELINADPGDIIVYRNIAAQIKEDDISLMAILQDAVEVCKVEYIIVCGYSHCLGITDVLSGKNNRPLVNRWLDPLNELYEQNRADFDGRNEQEKAKRLSELNIRRQIVNLSQLDIIQKAWEKGNHPHLLGWYFDLPTGALREIFSMEENRRLKQVSSVFEIS
jgi:carbonic anhydrase